MSETPPKLPPVTDLLPHRGRFLLIERLVSMTDTRIEAVGHFTEEDVEGHFPGKPIVPGVLLLEAMAQTMACGQLGGPRAPSGTPVLLGFDRARFRAPVIPPASVHFSVTLKELRAGVLIASGEGRLEGARVCSARLMATVIPDETPHEAPHGELPGT